MLTATERRVFDKRFATLWAINPESVILPHARHRYSIKDLKIGGVFSLMGKTYSVVEISRYDEYDEHFKRKLKYSAYELKLFCLEDGAVRYIEWEEDDEVTITFTIRSLSFRDLTDTEGSSIDADDLEQIVRDEDAICVTESPDEYCYNDDWAARYYRGNGTRDGFKVYFYDFEGPEGLMLTIEAWIEGTPEKPGLEYEIFISRVIAPRDLEILALGATS